MLVRVGRVLFIGAPIRTEAAWHSKTPTSNFPNIRIGRKGALPHRRVSGLANTEPAATTSSTAACAASDKLLIIDELGYVPLSQTGAELLFEVFSQRYERGATIVTSNLPFDKWTSVFGSERLTGALLDRPTHHVHILEMNGESYRLAQASLQALATRYVAQ